MPTSPGRLFTIELEPVQPWRYEIIGHEACPKEAILRMLTRVEQQVRKFVGDGGMSENRARQPA
jgi:hypothetical protein